jgi:gentisate 1,2-dioxygenase
LEYVGYYFADRTGVEEPKKPELIPAVSIPREAIDEEIDRLASLPRPANGRPSSRIANPLPGAGEGLAPGIDVTISVLKPGERMTPIRHNSSRVNFSIRGDGESIVDDKTIRYGQYDVVNTTSWVVYKHCNDSLDFQVRLTDSNAPLLEKMKVHIIEDDPQPSSNKREDSVSDHQSGSGSPFGTFLISDDGAYLMPYEKLINPDVLKYFAALLPVGARECGANQPGALGESCRGRRLYLLYNRVMGRTNGTTSNFFATFTIRPKNTVDRPHRHVGAAINYSFAGRGYSLVEGTKYPWKAGDLMISAPAGQCIITPHSTRTSMSSPFSTARSTSGWVRCSGSRALTKPSSRWAPPKVSPPIAGIERPVLPGLQKRPEFTDSSQGGWTR